MAFYLLLNYHIIQFLFAFILLERISLRKYQNIVMLSFILIIAIIINYCVSMIASIALFTFLTIFAYICHPKMPIGQSLLNISLASLNQHILSWLSRPWIRHIHLHPNTRLSFNANVFIYLVGSMLSTFLIIKLLQKYILPAIKASIKNTLGYVFSCFILIYDAYQLYMYIDTHPKETAYYMLPLIVLIFIFLLSLISLFSIYSISSNQKLAQQAEKKEIEHRAMILYTEELDRHYKTIRAFKHDYMNILSTLEGYLANNDLPALKKYYHRQIQPTRTIFTNHFLQLSDLQKIDQQSIRNILMTKLIAMQENGAKVQIEVSEKIILPTSVDLMVLIRVIGILLDNAAEELVSIQHGKLDVAFFNEGTSVVMIIQNTVRPNIEPLHLLKKAGFSTKGDKRGLGLTNVDLLLKEEESLLLETQIDEKHFIQKIMMIGA